MSQPPSPFCAGTSRLKRAAPLPEPADDARTLVGYEARECRLHSRRVVDLLAQCLQGYQGDDGECDPEEAMCLLAAVDDAARAARAMLTAMGRADAVERWETASAQFHAGGRPRGKPPTRGASRPKGAR